MSYYPAFVYGGGVPAILRLMRDFSRLGNSCTIYTTDANGINDLEVPKGCPVEVEGTQVWYFRRWWFGLTKKPFNIFFSPEMGRSLRKLKAGDYDLILVHSVWGDPGRLAANAASRTGIPYIYYTHGAFESWALRHKYWKKRLYMSLIEGSILRGAAGIVTCNDNEIFQLRQLGVETLIQRIPWGVEVPSLEILPSRELLEEFFPQLSGRPYLLFLSRLHPKKGLDLLIPAFAGLAQDFPDWRLVIAGPDEGGYRAHLEGLVSKHGIKSQTCFTGMVTGKRKEALLTYASIYTLPSYSEGFPVAVAEAMGYGLPMVITDTCYVPEVAQGGAGFVIPAEKRPLAEALRKMMGDPGLRRKCSLNARQLAQDLFSWEAVVEKTISFYRSVIS